MIWCASVVLPAPGIPAIRLNENSGTPPARILSSPGTPVSRRRMGTFFDIVLSPRPFRPVAGFVPAKQSSGQRFTDQRVQQLDEIGRQRAAPAFGVLRRLGFEACLQL